MKVLLLALLLPAPALALECQNPATQVDMTRCAQLEYETADQDPNRVYKSAMQGAKSMDAGFPGAQPSFEQTLRDAQRAWIPFRDKACLAQSMVYRGGSMQSLEYVACLTLMTQRRTQDLFRLSAAR